MFSTLIYFQYIYSCDSKAEFSAVIIPVFSDPSEIILICWFGARESLLLMFKTGLQLNIFVKIIFH